MYQYIIYNTKYLNTIVRTPTGQIAVKGIFLDPSSEENLQKIW